MKSRKASKSDLDELYEAILCLETKDECRAFFEDLCTVLEIQTISQRLQVAKLLRGHHVYNDIVTATGASTATISRVNRSPGTGYEIVFSRLQEQDRLAPMQRVNAGLESKTDTE
ncbi:MAG: hypothetical protein K2H29_01885 [Oscillospiraceae bacterium]|nr:hypothetical protein [Oscillospiraceae bacterium]